GTVQDSAYATIGPIPIAILGLGMYVALGTLALLRLTGRGPLSFEHASLASWTIALMGTIYAAYLTYVEIWVIDAICQWCVLSAIIGLIILIVESTITWAALLAEGAALPEAGHEHSLRR